MEGVDGVVVGGGSADDCVSWLVEDGYLCWLTVSLGAGESSPWLARSCRLAVEAEERRLNDLLQSGGE